MKQNAKKQNTFFFILAILLISFPSKTFEIDKTNSGALIGQAPTLVGVLEKRENYKNKTQGRNINKLVNILIVPGHDDENWGTEFRGVKEVELNRMLAKKLYEYLSNENGINPVLVSGENGYNSIFERYFNRDKKSIEDFIKNSKKTFGEKISEEDFSKIENNFHNVASDDVRQKLYGINNWVNNEKFDLVIHIHFNDYAGRKWNQVGEYDGFAIYTPGVLFENYKLSRSLANSVFEELKKVRPVSNLEEEKEGIIEDHELIALGANESLAAGSILVEYGYIYESIFADPPIKETSLDYFAYATYKGIKKMLNEVPQEKEKLEVQISKNKTSTANIVWQFQKTLEGVYPPKGKSLRDCPISGYFGGCSGAVN